MLQVPRGGGGDGGEGSGSGKGKGKGKGKDEVAHEEAEPATTTTRSGRASTCTSERMQATMKELEQREQAAAGSKRPAAAKGSTKGGQVLGRAGDAPPPAEG